MATHFVASSPVPSSPVESSPSASSSHEQPHHNPCAQCGNKIAQPSWSEGDARRTAYVWSCNDCGYEFTTIAIYPAYRDHEKIAA